MLPGYLQAAGRRHAEGALQKAEVKHTVPGEGQEAAGAQGSGIVPHKQVGSLQTGDSCDTTGGSSLES